MTGTHPVNPYTYLALGDSYTIGEGVPVHESFPYQTIQLLRKAGVVFYAPEIVAKTGWTTDELQAGIDRQLLLPQYEIVSLLIGVNNQYRGKSIEEYTAHFEQLLQQAIQLAGNQAKHVFVLSIPDWGITPFGAASGRAGISGAIDAFNTVNKQFAQQYGTHYMDITPGTREAATDESLLTSDRLHPSGKDYSRWAAQLARAILQEMGVAGS